MKFYYKEALRVAAEQAYKDEVVDTGMEELIIGEDNAFFDKNEWVACRMSEWLEEAEINRAG